MLGDGTCSNCAQARQVFNEMRSGKFQEIVSYDDCRLEMNATKQTISIIVGRHVRVKIINVPREMFQKKTTIELRMR